MTEKKFLSETGKEVGKEEVISEVEKYVTELGLEVAERNDEKPWGAYWRFEDQEIEKFATIFFPEIVDEIQDKEGSLSPKFLLVAPNKRLSWQYHFRRSELWKVVQGVVGVKVSESDEEPEEVQKLLRNDTITLKKEARHRLIGLDGWGLVAEIWVHEDNQKPSDEEDIVRISDDFWRK